MNTHNANAYGFAQANQMQTAAAEAQRRANQSSDTVFEDMSAQDQTALKGQPPAPVAPTDYSSGGGQDGFDPAMDTDVSILTRAKRRAAKYIQQV